MMSQTGQTPQYQFEHHIGNTTAAANHVYAAIVTYCYDKGGPTEEGGGGGGGGEGGGGGGGRGRGEGGGGRGGGVGEGREAGRE